MKEKYIQQLQTEGYCRIPQVYSADEVKEALDLTKYWYEKSKDSVSTATLSALSKKDMYLWNPQYKDHLFLDIFFRPAILHEILMHFLNDQWFRAIPADQPNYILQNLMGRSSDQLLPLHIDSFMPYHSDFVYMMQAGVILEEQNEENGCTMVIPGSHLSGKYANQDAFKDAVPIISEPGDLVMWDSRIWHGTMPNKTDKTRWSVIAAFSRWWIKQMFNYTDNLPQHIYDKLTDNQKAMLGFCSIAYNDETEGVDRKRGYDTLLKNVEDYRYKRQPEVV